MMAKILDGKNLRDKILNELVPKVDKLKSKPTLAIILVGSDPASEIYVREKEKAARYIGINFKLVKKPLFTKQSELEEIIEHLNRDAKVKGIVVQKPTALLLIKEDATVTICHSKTNNLKEKTSKADILVVAAGVSKLVKVDMVKSGAVVIDVGINRGGKRVIGDVDFERVKKKASFITPVPGGVGPMIVAGLMMNLVEASEK